MSHFLFPTEVHLSYFNATTHGLERTTVMATSSYNFWRAIVLAQKYIGLHHMAFACKGGYDPFLSFSEHFT